MQGARQEMQSRAEMGKGEDRADSKSSTEQLEAQPSGSVWPKKEMMVPLPKMGKLERRDPREMWDAEFEAPVARDQGVTRNAGLD